MAKVRVGVTKIKPGTGFEAEEGEGGVEVFQHWVEIDGHRFTTADTGLMEVSYGLGEIRDPAAERRRIVDALEAGEEPPERPLTQALEGIVTIRMACHGFETVDHREPPA